MHSRSREETIRFAKEFAKGLAAGAVLALEGPLGSGKTTFVKGLALGLGLADEDEVKSPTFVLMHLYPTRPVLYHFDLYRLEKEEELDEIGFEEFLQDPESISCVEWAEKGASRLPGNLIRVRFGMEGENGRSITISDAGS